MDALRALPWEDDGVVPAKREDLGAVSSVWCIRSDPWERAFEELPTHDMEWFVDPRGLGGAAGGEESEREE
jgi:hypothetical protein